MRDLKGDMDHGAILLSHINPLPTAKASSEANLPFHLHHIMVHREGMTEVGVINNPVVEDGKTNTHHHTVETNLFFHILNVPTNLPLTIITPEGRKFPFLKTCFAYFICVVAIESRCRIFILCLKT
eukprot:m.2794 g.2794  ORF g.2794 m.2794 type:complete len:126 (+) comp1943_c0_seq1:1154-1531(+)